MTTYEAIIKIDSVEYVISWDSSNKISIPADLEAVTTADELIRLLNALHAVRNWLDTAIKKKISMKRDD